MSENDSCMYAGTIKVAVKVMGPELRMKFNWSFWSKSS